MRKRITGAIAAITAVSALALTGCSTDGAAAASADWPLDPLADDQQVEIVFESYNLMQAGAWTETINALVAEFEAEHPNIDVKAQPTQGTSTAGGGTAVSVQTQLLAGNPPDVAQLTFDTLDFAVNELGAKSITDMVGEEALQESFGGDHPFHPRAATLGDWKGKTYGMPYVFSTPVLFYNSTALQAAGLPADPDLATWDDVAETGRAVTAKTGKPSLVVTCAVSGGNWCMQAIFRSAGGGVLSDDRTAIEFGKPESVAAVQMLRDLYDEGVLANLDTSGQNEAFTRGDAVLNLTTSALQSGYMAGAQADGWELRAKRMPAFAGREAVPVNSGSVLSIFSNDPAKQAASWEFVKFMTSDRAYQQISSKIGYLPLRPSLTEDAAFLKDWADSNPLLAPNLEQLDEIVAWTSYPGNSYVQVDTILATAVEEAVFYGKDPAATLGAAAERAQELIS
jgi:multiple sugar transport system substrate-binding protein